MARRPFGRRSERGQILVVAAGGMLGLLAIAALVLEGGTMLLNRRDGQNAADLSSVAGAHVIAQSYTAGAKTQKQVWDAIEANLEQNDCGPTGSAPCAWTATFVGPPASGTGVVDLGPVNDASSALPADTLGVRVDVTRSPGAILGRIIGRDHWDVSVEGTAITQKTIGGAGTLLPIAVCGWKLAENAPCVPATVAPPTAFRYVPGQIYDMTDGKVMPGGFGWLSWEGANNPGNSHICPPPNNPGFTLDSPFDPPGAYDDDVIGTNPADGETWFPNDPGKSNSKPEVRDCLDALIAAEATVLVPIYDLVTDEGGNNSAYHITGIAAFQLVSRSQPAIDNIRGTFKEYYSLSNVPDKDSRPPDVGDSTYSVGLVK